jgi:hypothetical protein
MSKDERVEALEKANGQASVPDPCVMMPRPGTTTRS